MSRTKAILVMLSIAMVWLLRPIVKIRFGKLFISRIGHLAGNTECYLCEKEAGINRTGRVFDLWCPEGKAANTQLLKMYSRVLPISHFAGIVNRTAQHWAWWKEHQFNDDNWGRDIHNLMEKQPPHIKFTKAEEKRGQALLRALGIPLGAKWVCIINRDPMYLKATQPGVDYDYHSFRDSNIQNYRLAAQALIEKGYFVLRMGHFVSEAMRLKSELFIDYACHPLKSDFADVYLGAKCAFCISNGTGFDGIPMVFRRPICFVNEAPFEYLSTWMPNSLAIWKHHFRGGVRMSVDEIVASGAGLFSRTEQYQQAGISLVENTPEEIRYAALEMLDLQNRTPSCAEFWKKFPRSRSPFTGARLHGEIRLRIGTEFLLNYAN